jgi:type II pantothenate kinase
MNYYNTFYEIKDSKIHFVKERDFFYPHISVNIGSGISILIVKSVNDIKRETGTLIGGGNLTLYSGTLLGLAKILIGMDNFDEIMKLAEKGDNTNVDLLIRDIYGGSAKNLGEDIIASR